jgi:hypothetical protein
MSCLLTPLAPFLRPVLALFYSYDDMGVEDSGYDAIYLVLAFSAAGMWLVFKRFENIRNRAVDFEWPVPEVSRYLHMHIILYIISLR